MFNIGFRPVYFTIFPAGYRYFKEIIQIPYFIEKDSFTLHSPGTQRLLKEPVT